MEDRFRWSSRANYDDLYTFSKIWFVDQPFGSHNGVAPCGVRIDAQLIVIVTNDVLGRTGKCLTTRVFDLMNTHAIHQIITEHKKGTRKIACRGSDGKIQVICSVISQINHGNL